MLFAVNIAVEQKFIMATIMIAVFTSSDVHQHTYNRSRLAALL